MSLAKTIYAIAIIVACISMEFAPSNAELHGGSEKLGLGGSGSLGGIGGSEGFGGSGPFGGIGGSGHFGGIGGSGPFGGVGGSGPFGGIGSSGPFGGIGGSGPFGGIGGSGPIGGFGGPFGNPCLSPITTVPGCIQEIMRSFFNAQPGFLGPACCKAFLEVQESCWSKLFPPNPFFTPLLKNYCATQAPNVPGTPQPLPGTPQSPPGVAQPFPGIPQPPSVQG